MRYEFDLEDYWDIIEEIHDRDDVDDCGFKQIQIDEREDSCLCVYGYRIYIPELNLTVREGVEYYKSEDGEEDGGENSVILYDGDEKDPKNYTESYCNIFLTSLVRMIASGKGLNTNPKCYIDDSEFEFWEE